MAADYLQIYKGRDLRVPMFDVKIRGKDLPHDSAGDIVSVRYTDSIDQIDTFDLTVNNWDAKTRDFKYTGPARTAGQSSDQFDPGTPVELWMGYRTPTAQEQRDPSKPDPLRLMLAGVITSIAPSFSAGQPTMKVSCQNVIRLLQAKPRTDTYENKTDSQIAEDVGKKGAWKIGSLEVKVRTGKPDKPEPVHAFVMQDNQYDIIFLLQRAHAIGYDLVLQQEVKGKDTELFLYFGPSKARPREKYLLEWGRSLIQFEPTLSTTRQVKQVTVRFWNGVKKQMEEAVAKLGDLEIKPLANDRVLKRMVSGFTGHEDVICDKAFRDKQAAAAYARSVLADIVKGFVTAKGSTFGTPDLRAGSTIQVDGLGEVFSGHYYITSSTHTIDANGYVTQFDCRLEEKNQ